MISSNSRPEGRGFSFIKGPIFKSGLPTSVLLAFTLGSGQGVPQAMAQQSKSPSPLAQNFDLFSTKTIYLEYKSEVPAGDVVRMRVRDQNTGANAIINLQHQPSAPQVWFGYFSLNYFRGDSGSKVLEFFDADGKKLFLFSDISSSEPALYIFNTAEQLARHMEQFANQKSKTTPPGKLAPPTATVAQQQVAVRLVEQQQEQVRMSIEETLALKREEQRKAQEAMNAKEKKRRKEEASKLAQEAMASYKSGDYTKSVELYGKASDLDPENESYYYQYGVALYKINNYNKSLAILSLAEDPDLNQVEKDYYIALNHMKLKEYDKARKELVEIRSEDDPTLSPMASFFAGNIEMQQQKYAEARKSFEYTLDKSADPQIDKAAEEILEQLDRIENFIASQKEKFRITLNLGTSYDSNILNVALNNVATDAAGYRANYGATFLANLYRTMEMDLGAQIAASDYYSVNKKFASEATLSATDPLVYTATLPLKGQAKLGEQNLAYNINPTYSSINMNPDGTTRRQILASSSINGDFVLPLKPDLITHIKLDYGSDRSYLTAAEDDNQSNNHNAITLGMIKLVDLKGERTWMLDLTSYKNNADGRNNRYNKTSLGLTYSFPTFSKFNGSLKLDYYNQKFLETDTARTDNVWSMTLGASKDLSKALNLALSLQYSNSSSQNELYTYNKYTLLAALTHTTSIQKK